MSLATINIEPSILIWARKTLGLSIEEVAGRLKRDPNEIAEWEAGLKQPTFAQLENLAEKIYKRPLALFFLPKPPEEASFDADFRTMNSAAIDELSDKTRIELRKAKALQKSLPEIFGPKNPTRGLIDVHFPDGQTVDDAIQTIRSVLGLTIEQQQKWTSDYNALNDLRGRIEKNGIFVFQLTLKDIRGFAMYDDEYPIIGLSSKDLPQGRTFTILHELCHLLFSDSDLFLNPDLERVLGRHKETERVCNQFAAEILLPTEVFSKIAETKLSASGYVSDAEIARLAKKFHAGRIVVVRRLKDLGFVDKEFYLNKQKLYANQYKGKLSEIKLNNGGGPGHYNTKISRLGKNYLTAVFDRIEAGKLTPLQASQLMGVKIDNFPKLLEKLT